MLGAVAGDIIGSPYRYVNAEDRYFDLGKGVRGWSHGREVTFHPRITDESVLMMATAKWLIQDEQHRSSRFISQVQETCKGYLDNGFSPFMQKWVESENPKASSYDISPALSCVIPAAMEAKTLPEAISVARQVTEAFTTNPQTANAAMALGQALWMAGHGRTRDDISFAMQNDFSLKVDMPSEEMSALLMGAVREPVIVNGEETGEFYLRESGRMSRDSEVLVTAALQAFLSGEGFEDSIRRAVALGGPSDTVASLTGALAERFHGSVPEKIKGICGTYMPSELRSTISSFEAICLNRTQNARVAVKQPDNSFNIIRHPDGSRIFSVPSYRTDIISTLKERFGENITIMKPSQAQELIRELSERRPGGTYLESGRADVRTVYFQDGQIKTSATLQGEHLPPIQDRVVSRQMLCEIADYATKVKGELQSACGYKGEGSIHFENAYYPVILHDKVEVWKGDLFAGSVGIDPASGLLKLSHGGDFGPMEWFGERTDSVFNSLNMDSMKQSLGNYCLDEGRGIYDANRPLNKEVANNDVARSKDTTLQAAIESQAQTQKVSAGIKR